MNNNSSMASIERLRQQADAVRLVGEAYNDEIVRTCALAAAETIQAIADKRLSTEPVLQLPANASNVELRAGRIHQSVQRGENVYLPVCKEKNTPLPNLLLRSALFSASNSRNIAVSEEVIASQGDTSITFTGFQLNEYDKRVFAVCLEHYRDEQPLFNQNNGSTWIRNSYWKFAKELHVEPGLNVYKAIRQSLVRLNAAHLRLRMNRRDIPLPPLIDVAFNDSSAASNVRGSDILSFRIHEEIAKMFGKNEWTALDQSVLHSLSGLPAWIASFYSTHAKSFPLQISDLWRYSGAACDLREFKRRLKNALTKLQSVDIPLCVRVKHFETSGTIIIVHLARWNS